MRITKYGVTLWRLKQNDIELVRQMRNHPEIRKNMQFRGEITPQQQLDWFRSIDNIYNNYYIIEFEGRKVGLINGKNANFETLSSEGGIFIWDKACMNSIVGPASSVILSDNSFYLCGFKRSLVKVMADNKAAYYYNYQMGYRAVKEISNDPTVIWMELTVENYEKYGLHIKKWLQRVTGDISPLTPHDFNFDDDSDEELKRLYSPLPQLIRDGVNMSLQKQGRKLP